MATVLLVDDDLMILEICKGILTIVGGLRVLQASNGREALEIAQRDPNRIDILVSDISMPGLTGIELADLLPSSHPETKILLMSGCKPDDSAIKDCWKFLAKPFRPADLMSEVNYILGELDSPADGDRRAGAASGNEPLIRPMPLALPMNPAAGLHVKK